MEDTAERVRELQLLHVTRDMHVSARLGGSRSMPLSVAK